MKKTILILLLSFCMIFASCSFAFALDLGLGDLAKDLGGKVLDNAIDNVKDKAQGVISKAVDVVTTDSGEQIETDTADPVALTADKAITGRFAYDKKSHSYLPAQKEYTYTTPKKGYFTFKITPLELTRKGVASNSTTSCLNIIVKANDITYYNCTANYNDKAWTSSKMDFKAGTEVKILVSLNSDSLTADYATYKVEVIEKAVSYFESEKNNTKKTADKIKSLGKNYKGLLDTQTNDVDWFVFTAPAAGKYKVYATHKDTCCKSPYPITVYKGDKKLASKPILPSDGEQAITLKVKMKKDEKLYIKVAGPTIDLSALQTEAPTGDQALYYYVKVKELK